MEQMGSAVYKVKVIHELAFVQIALLKKEGCVSQCQRALIRLISFFLMAGSPVLPIT